MQIKMFEKMMDSYKTLIIIPIIITLLALACITINGLDQGVELKGGSQAVLQLNDNISSIDLQNQLSHDLGTSDVKVTNNGDNQVTVDLESGKQCKFNRFCKCNQGGRQGY